MKNLKFLSNKKGVTLIEVIIYIALLAMIIPTISTFVVYGFDSYRSDYNLVQQESIVTNAIEKLRKDIELSSKVEVKSATELCLEFNYPSTSNKTWKIDASNNTLCVASGVAMTVIVKGIDASKSNFKEVTVNNFRRVVLEIKPIETNNKKYKNRNFLKPIITEFSVRYKN